MMLFNVEFKPARSGTLALILTTFLAASASQAAAISSYTMVNYGLSGPDGLINGDVRNPASAVEAGASYYLGSGPSRSISGAVRAEVDYGKLKVEASTVSAGVLTNSQAAISAAFYDQLTINAAGLEGQQGWITLGTYSEWYSTIIAGGLQGIGAQTQAHVSLQFGEHWLQVVSNHYISGCSDGCTFAQSGYVQTDISGVRVFGPLDTKGPFMVPVIFGQKQQIGMIFTANTWASGNHDMVATAHLDGSHSAYWGGIDSVLDAMGKPVSYTAISDSGTDYRSSMVPGVTEVPEPASLALFGLGALGLSLAQQGKRLFSAGSPCRRSRLSNRTARHPI